jgi:hypothetical protein
MSREKREKGDKILYIAYFLNELLHGCRCVTVHCLPHGSWNPLKILQWEFIIAIASVVVAGLTEFQASPSVGAPDFFQPLRGDVAHDNIRIHIVTA